MSLKSTVLTALAALALAAPAFAQSIEIYDQYARSASPMAKTGAAFMMIHNTGGRADRLIGVASPAAKMVQLHTHREEGGVMKMIHVEDGFAIPAGETFFLERGGNHIMMMGLTEPFEPGKTIPLTLTFEQAGEIGIEVPVDLDRKPEHGAEN
ncbi:copper chaperone PCu(A)C [Roseovarius ramblicola]|uniref:Copper chaperone PCu(A)C n=1 Tax=Roseovarius ramblicola TaxID=2022336 RepID=A0ABV5HVF3_9RHOB